MSSLKMKSRLADELRYDVFGILTQNGLKKANPLSEAEVLKQLKSVRKMPLDETMEKIAVKCIEEWKIGTGQGSVPKSGGWTPRLTEDIVFFDAGDRFILRSGACLKYVYRLPEKIATVTGSKILSSHSVVKILTKYIHKNNLYDPADPTFAICDGPLQHIFDVKRLKIGKLMAKVRPLLTSRFPGNCPCCAISDSSEEDEA